MNAYCIETRLMEQFTKSDITVEHFRAALAFPFIYPPGRIGSKHYYEGSAFDPLESAEPLGADRGWGDFGRQAYGCADRRFRIAPGSVIRLPRHLLDAYGISILTPIVSLAQAKLRLFKRGRVRRGQARAHSVEIRYQPEARDPTLTDWSRSNLNTCSRSAGKPGTSFARRIATSFLIVFLTAPIPLTPFPPRLAAT